MSSSSGVIVVRPGKKPVVYYQQTCTQCDALLEVREDKESFACPECGKFLFLSKVNDEKSKVIRYEETTTIMVNSKPTCTNCKCRKEIQNGLCYDCERKKCDKCGLFEVDRTSEYQSTSMSCIQQVTNKCKCCGWSETYVIAD